MRALLGVVTLAAAPAWAQETGLRVELGRPGGWSVAPAVAVAARVESAGAVPVDRDGGELSGAAVLAPEVRAGATATSGNALRDLVIGAELEADLVTGHVREDGAPEGEGYPDERSLHAELRKANARVSFRRFLNLGGGVMTSHWGLGLVANDGAHGWTPGGARFSDPRGGDRDLRGWLAVGLSEELGLVTMLAASRVIGDDVLLPGDQATQLIAAVLLGRGKRHEGGVYLVRRSQDADSGRGFDATVIDAFGVTRLDLGRARLEAAFEAALVVGETTLAPTREHRTHELRQLGVAARAVVEVGRFGGALDLLYASGDEDLYDERQTAFKPDPNHEMGLLLFRRVLAAQTARAPATAGDPDLVGVPPDDLERFPTRGSASSAVAVFPRGLWRPLPELEIYGGPLLAWSAGGPADPLATTAAGGAPRNALGGEAGGFLGAELDLGVRWHTRIRFVELVAGIEAGVLLPGAALADAGGATMDPIFGGRALVRASL
jgi:hypothetical protein